MRQQALGKSVQPKTDKANKQPEQSRTERYPVDQRERLENRETAKRPQTSSLSSLPTPYGEPWYLTRKQVIQITGLSRDTIDRFERRGQFPQRIWLSRRKVGWDVQEIEDWHRERKIARVALFSCPRESR